MSKLRVAAIGTGGIFQLAHAPAWQRVNKAEIVAVCDVDSPTAKKAADLLGCDQVFDSVDKLFEQGDFDLVDICTPHGSHAALTVKALQAGKHVICEKPIALEIEDAKKVLDVAHSSDKQLFVAHTRRFDRRWIEAKQVLKLGRIGRPVAASWHERSWAGFPSDSWRWSPENGGILADLGVHVADLFAWFFESPCIEVFAKTLCVRPEAKANNTADFAVVQMNFANKQQAVMELSWAHPPAYAPFYSSLEIIGTEGKLRLSDRDASPMIVVKDVLEIPRYSPLLSTFSESFEGELTHFVQCAIDGFEPRITAMDAFNATASIIHAQESARTGVAKSIGEARS